MDVPRFDTLTRSLTTATSRRGLLSVLTGGLIAAGSLGLGGDHVEARKRGKRKKKRRDKKPKTSIDAVCSKVGDTGGVFAFGEDIRVAQTFTAGGSGSLVRAELLIDGDEETFGDYILQLGTVDAFGVPTNEILASTSVGNLDVPDGESTVAFTFAKPASVVAGVQYALILTRPGSA